MTDEPMMFAEAIRVCVGFVTWRHTTFIGEKIIDRAYEIEPRAVYDERQTRIMSAMRKFTWTPDDGLQPPLDNERDDDAESV